MTGESGCTIEPNPPTRLTAQPDQERSPANNRPLREGSDPPTLETTADYSDSGNVDDDPSESADDGWLLAEEYSVRLGGVVYRNVRRPIVVNDESPVSFNRHGISGNLAPSFELLTQDKQRIARVVHGSVHDLDLADYQLLSGDWGFSILDRRTGRVWCDVRVQPVTDEYELDCSCLLLTSTGFPVILHPDRTLLGIANAGQPPNISRLTLTTDTGSEACAIRVEGGFYTIGIAIENFRTGIEVVHNVG